LCAVRRERRAGRIRTRRKQHCAIAGGSRPPLVSGDCPPGRRSRRRRAEVLDRVEVSTLDRGLPSQCMEVLSLASAFAALKQPRPFRPAFDARGASDVLVAEAANRLADEISVRLLVHALRGGRGDARQIRFGRERGEREAWAARYSHVTPPARSGC
jgi:hypothetical protein